MISRILISTIISGILAVQFARAWLLRVRPAAMLPFMAFFQLVLFFRYIGGSSINVPAYLLGNVAVVCIALIPATIPRPTTPRPPTAHWVK
jgi:hypothetical protein